MIEVTLITVAVLALDFVFVLLVGKFIAVGSGEDAAE